MSIDKPNWNDDEEEQTKEVQDDGSVDKRLKNRIIDVRERVAENEDVVFVKAPMDPQVSLRTDQQVQIWATTVRQYLKTIEPLLRSDELNDAHHYYKEIEFLDREVIPPDGATEIQQGNKTTTKKIRWSRFYNDAVQTFAIARDSPIFGPGFTPPEPKKVELYGLKSIIETDGIVKTWQVPLNPGSAFGKEVKIARPVYQHPISKQTLELAVRKADQFLQNAGIGLKIGSGRPTNNYSE